MKKKDYYFDIFNESEIHCRECKHVNNPYEFQLYCTKQKRMVQDDGCCGFADKRNEKIILTNRG